MLDMKPKNNNYKRTDENSEKENLKYILKLLKALAVSLFALFLITILYILLLKQ